MSSGLRELVQAYRAGEFTLGELKHSHLAFDSRTGRHTMAHASRLHMIVDDQNRVMVRILLDGKAPMSQMRRDLRSLGVHIAADDAAYRLGAAEAYIPLDRAEEIALMPGVAAMRLLRSPIHNVGAVTTEGATLLHSDQVNASGVTGKGITIGILSDSFNLNAEPVIGPSLFGPPITASDDVNTGDLPTIGVPDGRPGLKFLVEGPDGSGDEGRAIAQIAYDMAPSASFCFATADLGEFSFATSIRRLRTDSQCAADIIVDDVSYLAEPAFSDGYLAQAINDVATSTTLAGKPVAYFSAAGNNGGSVYTSDLRIVADADARALTNQPIDLTSIPPSVDTSGGFHNFNPDPNSPPILSQAVSIQQAQLYAVILQWDDPYELPAGSITTDLNLLVFDSSGKYDPNFSSTENNFTSLVPVEGFEDPNGGNFNRRLVIARTGKGSHTASKVFLQEYVQGGLLTGDFLDPRMPSILGHPTAKGAIAVAAYSYDNALVSGQYTPQLEIYSSAGPATIGFDSTGARLSSPDIRQKPEIAGVDQVSNTFLGSADFGDPFFSFPGTSAATPHAAGIAALLLEAAGGPGSLTPDQIRSKLIASTGTHDLDPFYSQAVLGDGNTVIKLSAVGGDDLTPGSPTPTDTKFFNLQFSSPTAGQTLSSLQIDLSGTGLGFNINARSGFPMKIGASSDGVTATSSVSGAGSTIVTLNFAGLQAGGFVQFGIGRTQRSNRSWGNSADLLAGAKVSATLASPVGSFTGTFVNQMGTGYTPVDGWGLVDAVKAVQAK